MSRNPAPTTDHFGVMTASLIQRSDRLCDTCAELRQKLFGSPLGHGTHGPWVVFHHHELFSDLVKSAQEGCRLCKLLEQGYVDAQKRQQPPGTKDTRAVLLEEDIADSSSDSSSSLHRFGFQVFIARRPFLSDTRKGRVSYVWGYSRMTLRRRGRCDTFFDLCTDLQDAAAWNGQFYGRQVSQEPDLAFAKHLLRVCLDGHECTPLVKVDGISNPERLVSLLTSGECSTPKLKLVSGSISQDYVALSHRWSDQSPWITTTFNVREREHGLDFESLPQTFKDAISASLALDYKYIWIDCLCILQDDSRDWELECAKMASIYANAAVTIEAAGAANSTSGFLGSREQPIDTDMCIVKYGGNSTTPTGQIKIRYAPVANEEEDGYARESRGLSFVSNRGWVLQERMLATRTLSFQIDRLVWECQCCYHVESLHFPLDETGSGRGFKPEKLFKTDLRGMKDSERYEWWYMMLQDYITRHLTRPADTLPAVSGIVSTLQSINGDKYIAGVWQGDFARGLVWSNPFDYRDVDASLDNSNKAYRAPSWSWARSDCSLATRYFPTTGEGQVSSVYDSFVELLSNNVQAIGKDPFGQVAPGSSIRCKVALRKGVLKARLVTGPPASQVRSGPIEIILQPAHSFIPQGQFTVDLDSRTYRSEIMEHLTASEDEISIGAEIKVSAMLVCNLETIQQHHKQSHGLVLVPGATKGTFERIGVFTSGWPYLPLNELTPVETWFKDAKMREVVLV